MCISPLIYGEVPKWLNGTGCNPVVGRLSGFDSHLKDHWLLKFDGISNNRDKEITDALGYGKIEYAYYKIAVNIILWVIYQISKNIYV